MREQRSVFGEVAELYERVRPGYPAGLVDDVMAFAPAGRALEVGAGTGQATVAFAGRGVEVLALEPDQRMAALAQRRLVGLPATVEVATFEAHPITAAAFALVYSATAWHWVDPEVGYHRAAEALQADGALALFWNTSDAVGELHARLDPVYAEHAPELHRDFRTEEPEQRDLRRAQEIAGSGLFGPVAVRRYSWSEAYDTDRYLALLQTYSNHRLLPDDRRGRLLAAVAETIEATGGAVTVDYITLCCLARRA